MKIAKFQRVLCWDGYFLDTFCVHCHCYADDTELYLSMNPDDTSQLNRHVLKTKAGMTLYEIHTKLIVLKIAYFSCPIIQSEVKAVDPHTYFTQLC